MLLDMGIGKGQRGLTSDMAQRLREFRWWAQRLAAEETIVRLERDLERLRSVPSKGVADG